MPVRASGGVSRKLPPSASSGANAIACSTPSTRPQRESSSPRSASRSSGSFTSSSSTSGGSGSRFAARSVSRRARPKPSAAPRRRLAGPARPRRNAIDCLVTTPVISSFLPSSITDRQRHGTLARLGRARHRTARPPDGGEHHELAVAGSARASGSPTRPCSSSSSRVSSTTPSTWIVSPNGTGALEHRVAPGRAGPPRARGRSPAGRRRTTAPAGRGRSARRSGSARPSRRRCAADGGRRSGRRTPARRPRSRCAPRVLEARRRAPGRRSRFEKLHHDDPPRVAVASAAASARMNSSAARRWPRARGGSRRRRKWSRAGLAGGRSHSRQDHAVALGGGCGWPR